MNEADETPIPGAPGGAIVSDDVAAANTALVNARPPEDPRAVVHHGIHVHVDGRAPVMTRTIAADEVPGPDSRVAELERDNEWLRAQHKESSENAWLRIKELERENEELRAENVKLSKLER